MTTNQDLFRRFTGAVDTPGEKVDINIDDLTQMVTDPYDIYLAEKWGDRYSVRTIPNILLQVTIALGAKRWSRDDARGVGALFAITGWPPALASAASTALFRLLYRALEVDIVHSYEFAQAFMLSYRDAQAEVPTPPQVRENNPYARLRPRKWAMLIQVCDNSRDIRALREHIDPAMWNLTLSFFTPSTAMEAISRLDASPFEC